MLAMAAVKRRRYAMWGIMSCGGTMRGKWKNEGSMTGKRGIVRYRWVLLLWSSFVRSLVFSIIAVAMRKLVHSMRMLVVLNMEMGKP